MAQRELKVKVTADIDKALTKLLDSIKKPIKVNVKVNIQQGDLNKVKKTLDSISKMKINPNVKVGVKTGELDKVKKDLDKLGSQKVTANVDVKTNSNGLDSLHKEMDDIERKAEEVSNTRVSPIGVATALAPLVVTLDQISDKILQISSQVISPILGDTWNEATDLFDSQRSFELQMDARGESPEWIAENMKKINEYGKQSKYSVAEMTDSFGQFYGSGKQNAWELVTGVAGISAYAKDASKAMASVNRQLNQMTDDSIVYNGDWNAIQNAIGGVAAQNIKDWLKLNKGITVTKKSLKDGEVSALDLQEAIRAVGNSNQFQVMATDVSTMGSAIDNFRESLTTALIGDIADPGPLRDVTNELVGIINDFTDEIPSFTKDISKGLDFLKKTFGEAFKDFSAKEFIGGLKNSFSDVAPTIQMVAKALALLTNNGKDTGKLVGNLIKFATGWKLFRGLSQPVLSLASAGGSLFEISKRLGMLKFGSGGILDKIFGGEKGGNSKVPNVKNIKAQALNTAKNIGTIAAVVGTVWASAKSMESISNMKISWGGLLNNLAAAGTGLTLAGGYMATIGFALDKIKGLRKNLVSGAVAVSGVSLVLIPIAKAIEYVSRIKINSNDLASNLGTLALSITGAGAVMTGIGLALTSFPQIAVALAAGATALVGVSFALKLITDNADGMVENLVSISKKFASLKSVKSKDVADGILKIAAISTALAGISSIQIVTGPINAIGGMFSALGNLAQNLNIDSALSLANKISKAKIPKASTFAKKMKNLQSFIDTLAGFNVKTIGSSVINGFTGFINSFGKFGNDAQLENLSSVFDIVDKINKVNIPKPSEFRTKVNKIKELMLAITELNSSDSFVEAASKASISKADSFGSKYQSANVDNIIAIVDDVTKLSERLKAVNLDENVVRDVREKIRNIKMFVRQLQDVLSQNGESPAKAGSDAVSSLFNAGESWLQNFNVNSIINVVNQVTDIVSRLQSVQIDDSVVETISTKLKSITNVKNELLKFAGQSKKGGLGDILSGITGTFSGIFGGTKAISGSANIGAIMQQINSVSEAVSTIKAIQIDAESVKMVQEKLKNIKAVLEELQKFVGQSDSGILSNIAGAIGGSAKTANSKGQAMNLDQIIEIINKMKTAITTLTGMAEIDIEGITSKVNNIKTVMQKIADLQITKSESSGEETVGLGSISKSVDKLIEITNKLNSIPELAEGINEKIATIKTAIQQLMTVGQEVGGEQGEGGAVGGGLESILTTVNNIIAQLQSLTVQFQQTGTSYAHSLVNGFTSGGLERIPAKMNEIKSRLNAMSDLSSIGRRMSNTLVNGFNPNGIISKINSIQNAINSLKGKTVTININEVTTKRTVKKANGGIIPEYHSTGGRVGGRLFKQRGTDTVPAMLTPGEYVLKRSVTNALGKGFLDALNKMNLSSAMAHLLNKTGNSNVVNNTYNTITQNVDNKASYLNGLSGIRRVVRS